MTMGAIREAEGIRGVLYHSQVLGVRARKAAPIASYAVLKSAKASVPVCSFCNRWRLPSEAEAGRGGLWVEAVHYPTRGASDDIHLSADVCERCKGKIKLLCDRASGEIDQPEGPGAKLQFEHATAA